MSAGLAPDRLDAVAALLARRPGPNGTGRTRTTSLLSALGDPQGGLSAVHVTGTNGKSSTAWLTTSLLHAAGWRTGSYTSPHLVDVGERIRIDGTPIAADELRLLLDLVDPHVRALDRDGVGLGFFDVLTAVGFQHLAEAAVDVAVVEVGRGGRDDATNHLDAPVVVLAPVGLDHAELGRTPVDVARVKLGLLRPGATLVTAQQRSDVTRLVRRTARELGARLVEVGRDVTVEQATPTTDGQRVTIRTDTDEHTIHLVASGQHQAQNLALALAAAEAWHGAPLSPDVVTAGAAAAEVPGRLETIERPDAASLLLDGAHNPAAATALAAALPGVLAGRRCVAVVGCASDKDLLGTVGPLARVVDRVVATTVPGGRGAPADRIAAAASPRSCDVVEDPDAAVAIASRLAGPDGVVLVTGSLHLVGAASGAVRGSPVASR